MQIWFEIDYFHEKFAPRPKIYGPFQWNELGINLSERNRNAKCSVCRTFLWLKIQESEKKKEIPFALVVKWIEFIWIEIIEIPIQSRPQYDEFTTF